ncbi:hypothetical protein DER46DRAFT_690005 [Fusarium sp. MPI-SDFR-AT-0072]|nr:hypothetical protein DER46DRAFT_690005 [Fusarium sp. MPI-SDFR-AT-0072]
MTYYLSVVEPSRLCAICDMALRSNILCVSQPHHKSGLDLEKTSDLGCYICGTIRHSNAWSRRTEECRSSSFEYVINLHSAGFVDTLEGLIIGKAPSGCCWAFQLWKEPDPASCTISYKPPVSPHDSDFIRRAKDWLDSCCQTHVKCRKSGPDYRPTRLIEVIDESCDSLLDWIQVAKNMKRVYEHAIFNLCSATASDSSGTSFVARHTHLLMPQRVKAHGEVFQLVCDGLLQDDITYCTLRSRAWIYQEWYLSKRSLWSQTQPLKESAQSGDLDDMDAWSQRVLAYMRTNLTRESDRLVAFSGVVQSFGQSRQLTEEYFAGLWRCHLPAALLWKVTSPARRSATYTAASWSWSSLAGDCLVNTNKDLHHEPCFTTVEQIMPLRIPGPDGFPMGGVITLSGYLFEVVYRSVSLFLGRGDFITPGDQTTGGELFLDEGSENGQIWTFLFLIGFDRGDEYCFRFRGLTLYQPTDQLGSFYRVGYMNWGKLPGVVKD